MNATHKLVHVTNLDGMALDWAAATAHGQAVEIVHIPVCEGVTRRFLGMNERKVLGGRKWDKWSPINLPGQALELLEAHVLRAGDACEPPGGGWDDEPATQKFYAITRSHHVGKGHSLRVAICRAVVLGVLGEAVEVPVALLDEAKP